VVSAKATTGSGNSLAPRGITYEFGAQGSANNAFRNDPAAGLAGTRRHGAEIEFSRGSFDSQYKTQAGRWWPHGRLWRASNGFGGRPCDDGSTLCLWMPLPTWKRHTSHPLFPTGTAHPGHNRKTRFSHPIVNAMARGAPGMSKRVPGGYSDLGKDYPSVCNLCGTETDLFTGRANTSYWRSIFSRRSFPIADGVVIKTVAWPLTPPLFGVDL